MRKLTAVQLFPLFVLVLTCFLAYTNAWPDTLAWDDEVFSVDGRLGDISLSQIGSFFTEDVWVVVGKQSNLYRPLLMVSVALDSQVFGSWAAGMHLSNILLHALATIAVYGLVHHLLLVCGGEPSLSRSSALLAAVIFAVHPIHTEVVNSIFNRSEMLVTLGMAGGLWWFLRNVDARPVKAWSLLGLVYLLVMLCRETGIMLPAITVVFLWLITTGSWQQRLRHCLPVFWLLIPLAIYLALRANALEMPAAEPGQGQAHAVPFLGTYFDANKILTAIAVWLDSLLLMLWPNPLLAFHGISDTNVWLALTIQAGLLTFAAYNAFRKKPGLLLGLAFFYLAILPSSRIIGGQDIPPHLAERYLYMPSAGLTIVLAFFLNWLAQKLSLRTAAVFVLITALVMTPLTWARNDQWSSTLRLIESDYAKGARSGETLRVLTTALIANGKFARAVSICDEHSDELTNFWYFAGNCAQAYSSIGRYDDAEMAFKLALNEKGERSSANSPAHFGLAALYVRQGRMQEAEVQFDLAIAEQKELFMKEYLEAEKLMVLFPYDRKKQLEARAHLEKSLELQPQFFRSRQNLARLERMLNSTQSEQE